MSSMTSLQHSVTKAEKGAETSSAPAFYIRRVKVKLATGEYPAEEVKCFCGTDIDDTVLAERDRYGIPHRMVVCKKCGLVRANPRMTQDAYNQFYNNEYRQIYGWSSSKETNNNEDMEEEFAKDSALGWKFKELIDYFDVSINTVFDIGCNTGAMLSPFKAAGCDCYGIDLGIEGIEYGKSKGLNLIYGGIEELFKIGKKADLIILSHVIEHFLDLEKELIKIRELLSDEGIVYIATPGVFLSNKNLLFQNAHTYQFTADTLKYVMECCGFEEYYVDDVIQSVWGLSKVQRTKRNSIPIYANNIIEFFSSDNLKMPKIRSMNKFTIKERKSNINETLAYKFPCMSKIVQKYSGDVVLVNGGPSINNYIDKIKEMHALGMPIIAIDRMYTWCFKHDITPDFIICMDACDDVNEGFKQINPDTIHLLSTQCNPSIFELLKGYKNYVFCIPQNKIDQADICGEKGYDQMIQLNTGGSVSIAAITASMALGFRNLHIFGFDCHITDGNYAKGIAGQGHIDKVFNLEIDGRMFTTTVSYTSFLQQFFVLYSMAKHSGGLDSIKFYGDSMIKFASKDEALDGDKI